MEEYKILEGAEEPKNKVQQLQDVVKRYEKDWEELSPLVVKLKKMTEDVFSATQGLSPELASYINSFEDFKKQQSHTVQVHRNHLGALQRMVATNEAKVNDLDKNIVQQIQEYDK